MGMPSSVPVAPRSFANLIRFMISWVPRAVAPIKVGTRRLVVESTQSTKFSQSFQVVVAHSPMVPRAMIPSTPSAISCSTASRSHPDQRCLWHPSDLRPLGRRRHDAANPFDILGTYHENLPSIGVSVLRFPVLISVSIGGSIISNVEISRDICAGLPAHPT